MNSTDKAANEWAKAALAEFLRRCFHSAARTLEWDAKAIRQAGERRK
jgi:hypothetical protein